MTAAWQPFIIHPPSTINGRNPKGVIMAEITISKVDTATSIVDIAGLKKKDTVPYLTNFLASKGVKLDDETAKNLGWIPTASLVQIAMAIKEAKKNEAVVEASAEEKW